MEYWNNEPTRLPDVHRPMDWQDRVVITGSIICGVVCLAILIWGR
jgi:hypothetical protein